MQGPRPSYRHKADGTGSFPIKINRVTSLGGGQRETVVQGERAGRFVRVATQTHCLTNSTDGFVPALAELNDLDDPTHRWPNGIDG